MSVNQSAESTASSLQRSGLSITVGDTKSIVLALQALQSKIRTLEQDRDYHQDQYEGSLQAHERYKLDMERQIEQERAAHHKREADLLDLLRQAREERAGLESALNGNKEDLGSFRQELEQMIAAEKEVAQQRESKLHKEVTKLRDEVKEEQARRAALLVTVEKLKEEREAALSTNEQLRIAMDDLLTRFEQLQQHQRHLHDQQQHQHLRHTPLPSSEPPRRSVSRGSGLRRPSPTPAAARRRGTSRGRGGGSGANTFAQESQRSARHRVVINAAHHTYEDPTCSSMLRDVRVVPDEAPRCAYPSVNSSLQHTHDEDGEAERRPHSRQRHCVHEGMMSGRSGESGEAGHSSARRDISAHHRNRHTPFGKSASARRAPTTVAAEPSSSSLAAPSPASPSFTLGSTAVNEVEKQLQRELDDLQRQYESTVKRGATEEIPSEVLAAALHRVATLIEQKKEQVKLLREARRELEEAVGSSGVGGGAVSRGSHNVSGVVGDDKQTRRTMLVNELRSLLAEASS